MNVLQDIVIVPVVYVAGVDVDVDVDVDVVDVDNDNVDNVVDNNGGDILEMNGLNPSFTRQMKDYNGLGYEKKAEAYTE